MKVALSHRVRVEILKELDKQVASVEELTETLGGDPSLDDVKYHLGILGKAGCLEVDGVEPVEGTTRSVYRIRRDVFLDPFLLDRSLAIEGHSDLVCNWLELDVDEVGEAQITEILRIARLELLMVEEQSQGRREVAGSELTPVVVGTLGFRANTAGREK